MWALPARSMPGSEMLFVEKTRIRCGVSPVCPCELIYLALRR